MFLFSMAGLKQIAFERAIMLQVENVYIRLI